MIIDDRTFIVNPAVEGSLIYIIAKKWGKNGNKKKSVMRIIQKCLRHQKLHIKLLTKDK